MMTPAATAGMRLSGSSRHAAPTNTVPAIGWTTPTRGPMTYETTQCTSRSIPIVSGTKSGRIGSRP
jgi:hypothetical protein